MALTIEEKKLRRRLKKRKGKVIFIAHYPDGMKEWLEARAAANGIAMSTEAVSILEAERARDFARKGGKIAA